jgi:hypothetical protein
LVKLALSGLDCPSLPDVFHLLYALSKSIGSAVARQRLQLQKQYQNLEAKLKAVSSPAAIAEVCAQIQALKAQQYRLETDHQDYEQNLHALSQAIHPFDINTGEFQFGSELSTRLQSILSNLEQLGQTYAPTRAPGAIDVWLRQIPNLSGTVHAWWQWVIPALSVQTQDPDIQNWVLSALLPWVYWHQQTQKTRQPQLKQGYQQAAQRAQARFLAYPFTQTLHNSEQQQWIDWAIWMCAKFQRTSSAVEGRNG